MSQILFTAFFASLGITILLLVYPTIFKKFRKYFGISPYCLTVETFQMFRIIRNCFAGITISIASYVWFNTIGITITYWIVTLLYFAAAKAFVDDRRVYDRDRRVKQYLVVSGIFALLAVISTVLLTL